MGVVAKVPKFWDFEQGSCLHSAVERKDRALHGYIYMHQLHAEVGSPLRNLNQDSVTEKDQEWDEIINAIGGYFKHVDSLVSLCLPLYPFLFPLIGWRVLLQDLVSLGLPLSPFLVPQTVYCLGYFNALSRCLPQGSCPPLVSHCIRSCFP